jgi:acyl-CoA reductase-like NAD-dependent aldehyde dehydrogenase
VPLIAESCFANAGQVCIKAQRLYVHRSCFDDFLQRIVSATEALAVGDPLDEQTVVGPMIEARHVTRVLEWIEEAKRAGARVLTGGTAEHQLLRPTLLTGAKPELRVCRDEIFGPVTVVEPVDDLAAGIAACNASRFGIQASVFTNQLGRALEAFEKLDYPGVLINDAPSLRSDNIPYGGVRDSGFGREGVAFAMQEITEPKFLSLRAFA